MAHVTEWLLRIQQNVTAEMNRIRQSMTVAETATQRAGKGLQAAFGNTGAIDKARARVKAVNKELDETTDEAKRLSLITERDGLLKGLKASGAVQSLREIRQEVKTLRNQLASTGDPKLLRTLTKDLDEAEAKLKNFNKLAGKSGGGALSGMMSTVAGPLAVGGAVYASSAAFSSILTTGMALEDSLAEFSAITEIKGEQLDDFGDRAQAMALKFGGSSVTQVNAMKNVLGALGGELAKTPELLQHITDNINVMSQAGRIDLEMASNAMTGYISSLGISLKDTQAVMAASNELMDTFAAASRAGAAEMDYLLESYSRVAPGAKAANMSLQETAAVFEILAANQIGSERAGTGMVAMLDGMTKITKSANLQEYLAGLGVNVDIVTNKHLSFGQRLEELGKIMNNDAAILEVFGGGIDKNIAQILMTSQPQLAAMTEEVKKTGVAHQQAAINMNTTSQRLARMRAGFEQVKLKMFDFVGGTVDYVVPVLQFLSRNFDSLLAIASLVGAYMAGPFVVRMGMAVAAMFAGASATAAQTLALGTFTGASFAATTATVGFGAALKGLFTSNPFGWILLAAGAAIYGIIQKYDEIKIHTHDLMAFFWEANAQIARGMNNHEGYENAQKAANYHSHQAKVATIEKWKNDLKEQKQEELMNVQFDPAMLQGGQTMPKNNVWGWAKGNTQPAASDMPSMPSEGSSSSSGHSGGGGGGGRATSITIQIEALMKGVTFNITQGMGDLAQQVEQTLNGSLTKLINDAEVAAS